MRAVLLLTFAGCMAACSRPDPAPADLDGVLHFLWDGWDETSEKSMAEAIGNLDAELVALDEAGDGLPYKGAQTRLTTPQIEGLTFTGDTPDPALANGFFVATEMDCSAAEIDEVFSALNQDELHPGTYDLYERTYTSDEAAYRARETDRLTWDVEIHASPAGFDYVEFIKGGTRWIEGAPGGDGIVARTWLIEPATEEDNNRSFDQDYQLDVYYERADGAMVHIWAMWRQIDMGTLGDQDSAALIAVTLSNGQGWDEDTEALCAELR